MDWRSTSPCWSSHGDAAAFADLVCGLLADPGKLRVFAGNSLELSRKFSIEAQVTALVTLYREAILEKSETLRKRISYPPTFTLSTFQRSNS